MQQYRSVVMMAFCVCMLVACGAKEPAESSSSPVDTLGVPPWNPCGYYQYAPITESSGFVVSRQHPGVCWTLNDSGNPPMLYATTLQGELIREFRVKDTRNQDWEALALDDEGQLWIGEIGNNSRLRTDLCLYMVPEPDPHTNTSAKAVAQYPYRYPEENVDAEGLFVYRGTPYIVSKEPERAVLYRFDKLIAGERVVLTRVGELNGAHTVTGADLSQDGTRLAVCTYEHLWVYHGTGSLESLIRQTPWSLAHDFSPEAIGFDGMDLVLTSESRNIYRLPAWWYERELILPPKSMIAVSEQPGSMRAEGGTFQTRAYRQAGLDMDGGHVEFSAETPGAALHQTINVPYGDQYQVTIAVVRGPNYAQLELLMDGVPCGERFDGHAPDLIPASLVSLGTFPLTQGQHDIGFRVVGKADEAGEYRVGIDAYQLRPSPRFPREYWVVGPFTKPEMFALDTPLPPEDSIDLQARFTGLDGRAIGWQKVATNANGLLDLQRALSPASGTTLAYALTYVYSGIEREAHLLLGSDDQIVVWVNGQETLRKDIMRTARSDEDVLSCHLTVGWNMILCKVGQNGGGWGLYLRVNDPDGSLQYATIPGE